MTGHSDRPIDVPRDVFDVSPAQRRVWALGGAAADTPFRVRARALIEGAIDRQRFLRAIESATGEYEILRTTVETASVDHLPRQVIHGQGVHVAIHDLTGLTPANRDERLGQLVAGAARRPVDGSEGLPWSIALIRVASDAHLLVVDTPALLCDGPGVAALVAVIWRRYHECGAGAPDPDILQYADASAWMNEAMDAPETAVGRNVWRRLDVSTMVDRRLPYARAADPDARFAPARTSTATISADLRERIARLPGQPTLEAVLLTSWRAVLRRVAADQRLDVGSVTDGRDYPGLEDAVGLFACVLPLKGASTESTSVSAAVQATSAELNESRLWRASFDWAWLGGLDHVGPGGRYASLVHEHRRWPDRYARNGVTLTIETEAIVDRFDLRLVSAESEVGARWWIEYDQARYSPADVARLAGQFEVLLSDAVRHPDKALSDLEVLSADERRFVVSELNPALVEETVSCVHELFEAQAADHPERPAVVCETETLDYGELNARANQLARYLRRWGIGPEVTVALCLERSVDLIVAVLATLKAGGAYVPLDPRLPPSRADLMLAESRAPLVVTRSGVLSRSLTSVRTVLLDQSASDIAAESCDNLGFVARPEHLAYVLFTSGSTGEPKGVAVERRQLAQYTKAVGERLEWAPEFSSATVTTLASDLGNTAIFPALCAGGCLHVVTEARAADAEAFAEYVTQHAIDVLKIVPSHLRALLSVRDPRRVLPRARLVLGGEAASWDLADTVQHLAPQCRVFNHYGPTETTVGATVFEVRRGADRPASVTVPIGRPLAHARVYVVDQLLRPVPVWVAGELLIGGAGVARGYLNAAERTTSRFVPDPVATGTEARVYRTGDRVRLLPTGDLEFLGRIDDQVKIRGYRVEPGEINAAILRQPGVRDAVVLVRESGAEKRLAAFIVPGRDAGDAILDTERIADALKRELPDYMVPAAITLVERLPLTPNGKIDRAALLARTPAPTAARSGGRSTPWEDAVAGVWRELLAIDEIGSQDNFYDLGGHSLLAIQAVALLEARTGLKVPARALVFNTLSQFAALCESHHPLQPAPPPSA